MHNTLKIYALLLLALLCLGSCKQKENTATEAAITEFPYVDAETAKLYAEGSTRIDEDKANAESKAIRQQKKLIAFDLDATITQHKTQITPEAKATLDSLAQHYALVMIGAGNCQRIYNQMDQYPIPIVGNYGMQESAIVDGEFQIVRQDTSKINQEWVLAECNKLREKYGYTNYSGESVEFHASGMVTFGLLGTEASKEDKLAFDPDKQKRMVMYPEVCQVFKDFSVFVGGSTSFDLAEKKYNKYDALMRYAQDNGYTKEQVLFVGDDFVDGGGDSHIRLGGMDYVHITDYTKFPQRMEFLYK